MEASTLAKTFLERVKAHKPELMIGFGLCLGAGAIVMAVKDTPACIDAFKEAEAKLPPIMETGEGGETALIVPPLDWKTKLWIYTQYYWKAAMLEAGSIFFIVWGTKTHIDAYTALMAVYSLRSAELDDLKKVISSHPDNWKKKFDEKRGEMHLAETKPEDVPEPCMTNTEVPMPVQLLWDDQAKVFFRMTDDDLRDALAEFTHRATTDPFQNTTINDWMETIGHDDILNGDYMILAVEEEIKTGPLKYQQVGVKESPTGEPARMMRFNWDFRTDTRMLATTSFSNV